jgi:hypothetical protein
VTARFDLDAALAALAPDLDWPPTPPLRGAVLGRLDAPSRRRLPGTWPRALVLAAIATIVLAAAVAAAVLLLPGLRLSFVPVVPTPSVASDPLGVRLALGERTPAGGVRGLLVPAELGAPDEVYVARDGDVVSLVYAADDRLPALADSGIGLLIQEIRGDLSRERVEKLVSEVGATVSPVTVAGDDGFWIEGPPHLVRYLDEHGAELGELTRLVGRTLVWERDGALIRIEGGLSLEDTLRIAGSLGP